MMSHTAYIGIGSNLGNALQNTQQAIDLLRKIPKTSVEASSSLYQTAPVDASGDDYINAVVRLKTELDALTLLEELWRIETLFGRERLSEMRREHWIWISFFTIRTVSRQSASASHIPA